MHNVFDLGLLVHRDALTITLSVEVTSEDARIVLFYSYTRKKVQHTGRL
jgi:hypothetical protein